MDYLSMNLEVFNKRVAEFEFPEDIYDENSAYTIELSKTGLVTLKYSNGNISRYAHSKYDPQKEADDFVAQFKHQIKSGNAIILYGLGMGYVARSFLKIMNPENSLIIYEPSWNIFKLAMENADLTSILSDARTSYIMGRNYNYIPNYLSEFINSQNYENLIYEGTSFYKEIFIEDYKKFTESLLTTVKKARSVFETFAGWGKDWTESIIRNSRHIMESNSYNNVMNIFPLKPVVVVAAGPSLDKNIDLLKKIKGKFPIVCVYTAYGALKKHNIVPDFIITLDTHQTKHEKEDELKEVFDIPVVYLPIADTKLIDRFKSYKIYCHTEHDRIIDKMLLETPKKIATIHVSGSVTISALHFAYYIGGDPIITLGFDLSYTGTYSHASGTIHTKREEEGKVIDGYENVFVKGAYEEKVRSSFLMENYLRAAEDFVKSHPEITFIDATEGGAYKEGMEIDTFANVIERYESKAADNIDLTIENALKNNKIFTDEDLVTIKENISKYKSLSEELLVYLEEGKELSEKVKDIFTYGKPGKDVTDKIIWHYCELDNNINQITDNLPVFYNVVDTIKKALKSHQPKSNEDPQLYFANHSILLYKELIDLTERIIDAFKEVSEYTQKRIDTNTII